MDGRNCRQKALWAVATCLRLILSIGFGQIQSCKSTKSLVLLPPGKVETVCEFQVSVPVAFGTSHLLGNWQQIRNSGERQIVQIATTAKCHQLSRNQNQQVLLLFFKFIQGKTCANSKCVGHFIPLISKRLAKYRK